MNASWHRHVVHLRGKRAAARMRCPCPSASSRPTERKRVGRGSGSRASVHAAHATSGRKTDRTRTGARGEARGKGDEAMRGFAGAWFPSVRRGGGRGFASPRASQNDSTALWPQERAGSVARGRRDSAVNRRTLKLPGRQQHGHEQLSQKQRRRAGRAPARRSTLTLQRGPRVSASSAELSGRQRLTAICCMCR